MGSVSVLEAVPLDMELASPAIADEVMNSRQGLRTTVGRQPLALGRRVVGDEDHGKIEPLVNRGSN